MLCVTAVTADTTLEDGTEQRKKKKLIDDTELPGSITTISAWTIINNIE